MSDRNLEGLSERERACLAHLEEAKKVVASFSEYWRDRQTRRPRGTWIKRVLVRKGVMGGRRGAGGPKGVGFVRVRVAPPVATTTMCRIRHPSGWTIECASYPE